MNKENMKPDAEVLQTINYSCRPENMPMTLELDRPITIKKMVKKQCHDEQNKKNPPRQ
jgi:hypothetical protein